MFFLSRPLQYASRLAAKGYGAHLDLMIKAVHENYKKFKYADCAFCIKALRELSSNLPKNTADNDVMHILEAEAKVLNRLSSEPADFFSITIWAQCINETDVNIFLDKLQSDALMEKLNTFAISSILVSLAKLKWQDEYLVDRMIIRLNKSPHQLTGNTISNILNSLVKLRYENTEVIDMIYKEGKSKNDFTPQGIAMTLNAMSHLAPLCIPSQEAFLEALIERTSFTCSHFTGQTVAVVLNSLSKLRVPRESTVMKVLFDQIPKVVPTSDGHSISLLCKALANLNVISDMHFSMIEKKACDLIADIQEQGIHFLLNYAALFNDRESCKEAQGRLLTTISEHLTNASSSYSSMGVTYCLHGLARCKMITLDMVQVALFSRAGKNLEKYAKVRPTKLKKQPPVFNGQEVGILLNAFHEFKYENQALLGSLLKHIQTWSESYSSTSILTTLWGLARVRKMIPDDDQVLEAVCNELYRQIDFDALGGRSIGSLALSYSAINVKNEEVVQNFRAALQNRSDQIEMKYLSIALTTMYSMEIPDFDEILALAIENLSLNVNTAHSNALARILHLGKTCKVHVSQKQVEAICALVEILFPKLKSFELSHILSALITFSPPKTCVASLDQYANSFFKQISADASRQTLERFAGFFAFSRGAVDDTLVALLREMARHSLKTSSHVEWAKRVLKMLSDAYPEVAGTSEYEAIQKNLQEPENAA